MTNKIKIKTLQKLVNPFTDDMFNIGQPIKLTDIENAIKNVDFLVEKNDTEYVSLVKKIAFLVKNPSNKTIKINLGFPEQGLEPTNIIYSGKLEYVAAIVRQEKEISSLINGSRNLSLNLCGCEPDTEIKENFIDENDNFQGLETINLDSLNKARNNSWSDAQFCLDRLRIEPLEALKVIDNELYNERGFVLEVVKILLENEYLEYDNIELNKLFSKSFYLTDDVLEEVAKFPKLFMRMWEHVYSPMLESIEVREEEKNQELLNTQYKERLKDVFLEYKKDGSAVLKQEMLQYLLEDRINLLENGLFLHELKNDNELKKTKSRKKSDTKIDNPIELAFARDKALADKLMNDYLSNTKFIENLCSVANIDSLYKVLPAHVKDEASVIKNLFSKKTNRSSYYLRGINFYDIPEIFFNNIENVAYLFNENKSEKIKLKSTQIENLTSDKEKLLTLAKLLDKDVDILDFYDCAWKNKQLKEDEEIIQALISVNHKIYENLSTKMKANISLVEQYLKDSLDLDEVPSTMWSLIKDEQLIKQCLEYNSDVLLSKKVPIAWKYNKDYILYLGRDIEDLKFSEKEWKKVLGKDINAYLDVVELSPSVYNNFPIEIKNDEKLTLAALKASSKGYEADIKIEPSMFGSMSFCIEAIKIKPKLIKDVPIYFLSTQDFLLLLTKEIDEGNIPDGIIDNIRPLQRFFERNEITENYSASLKTYLLDKKLQNKSEMQTVRKTKI